jgi:hypothetical protein
VKRQQVLDITKNYEKLKKQSQQKSESDPLREDGRARRKFFAQDPY